MTPRQMVDVRRPHSWRRIEGLWQSTAVRRVLALAVLLPLGLCPALPRSWAQAPERTVRIGVLGSRASASLAAFQEALRELGYVEGRNVTFEYRWADGGLQQLRALADEMAFTARSSSSTPPPGP
jgi:hypothetical protein